MTEDAVRQALAGVRYPGFSRDIVSFGLVKEIAVANGAAMVELALTSPDQKVAAQIKAESEGALLALPGIERAHVKISMPQTSSAPKTGGFQTQRIPGVGQTFAVASGKGGVGKSTVSVNLACALKRLGKRVGLLDCDIYGPSIPLMMGVNQRPMMDESERILPVKGHDIPLMSMGFLVDDDSPVIWRGPMIVKTIQQFLFAVRWEGLDVLLVDLPPGTGDAQLTLCQTIPLDGGVVVTTPQEASLGVVRKGISMFHKVSAPITGIVENMSGFTAPDGSRIDIFGKGGGAEEAKRQNLPFLGEVPLFTEIREAGDAGVPVTISQPDSPAAKSFMEIAENFLRHTPASA